MKPVCKFFRVGNPNSCRYGDQCRFLHADALQFQDTGRTMGPPYPPSQPQPHAERQFFPFPPRRAVIDPKYKFVAKKLTDPSTSKASEVPEARCESGASNASSRITGSDPSSRKASVTESDLTRPSAHMKQEQKDDENIYSPLSTLSADLLKAFEDDHFTIGKVPLLPPPLLLA